MEDEERNADDEHRRAKATAEVGAGQCIESGSVEKLDRITDGHARPGDRIDPAGGL